MKWKNRGHEFDDAFAAIHAKQVFYLFGAGKDGKVVLTTIRRLFGSDLEIGGFIDNDSRKWGTDYCGLPVFSPTNERCCSSTVGIVISTGLVGANRIEAQLESYGLKKLQDFYHYYVFIAVVAAYEKNLLYMPSVSFLPSTYCNLRCEACLNFTPYIKNFEHRDIGQLKREVDLFFQVVDYISLFHVSGGEPMLYPHLAELLSYISEHYGKQIGDLRTVTNGTVIPPKRVLDVLCKHEITVTLDDYREALHGREQIFQNVLAAFEDAGVMEKVILNKFDTWIDLAPMSTDNTHLNEIEMCDYFDSCRVPWQEYRGGRLYLCNYADYAAVAGIAKSMDDSESYDLRKYDISKLKELMEFRLGFSSKGYVEFCRHCAGYEDINPHPVSPAKQMDH